MKKVFISLFWLCFLFTLSNNTVKATELTSSNGDNVKLEIKSILEENDLNSEDLNFSSLNIIASGNDKIAFISSTLNIEKQSYYQYFINLQEKELLFYTENKIDSNGLYVIAYDSSHQIIFEKYM